jgi:hypothetical protein
MLCGRLRLSFCVPRLCGAWFFECFGNSRWNIDAIIHGTKKCQRNPAGVFCRGVNKLHPFCVAWLNLKLGARMSRTETVHPPTFTLPAILAASVTRPQYILTETDIGYRLRAPDWCLVLYVRRYWHLADIDADAEHVRSGE